MIISLNNINASNLIFLYSVKKKNFQKLNTKCVSVVNSVHHDPNDYERGNSSAADSKSNRNNRTVIACMLSLSFTVDCVVVNINNKSAEKFLFFIDCIQLITFGKL